MGKYNIIVTGIGGNIGQGLLRNLRRVLGGSAHLIGTDTNEFNAGLYFCDEFHLAPLSSDASYMPFISNLLETKKPDLVLSGTDPETVHLAVLNRPEILTSPPDVVKIFFDKHLSYLELKNLGVPFVKTVLAPEYDAKEFPNASIILKPKCGWGGREVHRSPNNPKSFSSDYIVQNYLEGAEYTTSFYVLKSGKMLGQITFERILKQGMTHQCEVSTKYDEQFEAIILKIINKFKIVGPCNFQSRICNGEIKIFEVNCRYSGTNSIRPHFGFDDVKYAVQEYILNEKPEPPKIIPGSAIRFIEDIIYTNYSAKDVHPGKAQGQIAAFE